MLDGINSIGASPTLLIAQREYVEQTEFSRSEEKNPFNATRLPAGEQKDTVTFSDEALTKAFESQGPKQTETEPFEEAVGFKDPFEEASDEEDPFGLELTDDEKAQLDELKARDREVRAHEQAHINAAPDIVTSGASFTYKTGPDGQRYAVGGEVTIDVSEGRTSEETIAKADKIKRAALAPAQPSGADRAAAAEAAAMANKARMELARSKAQETDQQPGPQAANGGGGGAYQALNFLI